MSPSNPVCATDSTSNPNPVCIAGAPLICGTAAYGIVLAIQENNNLEFIKKSSEELIQSRPTAVNLKWAVDRMMKKYPESIVIKF